MTRPPAGRGTAAAPILALWSMPRARSTAFFAMMIQRGDVAAVHEPFSYLADFGYVDLDGDRITSAAGLIAGLRALAGRRRVFVKETTGRRYPEVLADPQLLATDARHAFLIRHPRETIASRYAIDPQMARSAVGCESLWEVYAAVARATGGEPLVLDSADLLRRPAAVVTGVLPVRGPAGTPGGAPLAGV